MAGSRKSSASSKGRRSVSTTLTNSTRSASVRSSNVPSRVERTPDEHAPSRPGAGDDESTDQERSMALETPTSMPPKQLFVVGTNTDQTIGDEVTVSQLVAQKIFPHVKFVCNPVVELAFTNDARSICGIVRSYCNPPENIQEDEWWQNARKWVGRTIAIQRSSKNTKLKWSFMGKYAVLLL